MRASRRSTTAVVLLSTAFAASYAATPALAGSRTTTIFPFTGGNDGGFPHGGLIADASGALYGTTSSDGAGHNGVIYRLTPPAKGQKTWTQTTLYSFTGGADGGNPMANLLADNTGALYGTTYAGGDSNGDGVVFKLTPPATGQTTWTETVIHTFANGADGDEPSGTLIADASGNLYGTTTGGGSGVVGTVFELSPPTAGKTKWVESILYNFTGNSDGGEPFGSVLFAADGSLYGTTAGYGTGNYGTVYQLTPPAKVKGAWGFNLVHAFTGGTDGEVPRAGLIADASGALYGTTAGFDHSYGSVFKVTPTGGGWTTETLYNFAGVEFTGNGPQQAVSMDASGALYGTTLGDGRTPFGTVFKLTPPKAAGKRWVQTVLHSFQGGAAFQFPYSNVLIGAGGKLFGTAEGSAGESGFFPGEVWEIKQ